MSTAEHPGLPESFEHEVRECLSHLYDFTAMQHDPIVQRLAPTLSGLESIQTVRKLLIDTIEQLNQRETVTRPSRQTRLYHILLLRYVEEQPTAVILQRLAISERQYYRELQRAVHVVSLLLWEHIRNTAVPPETLSIQREIQRASKLAGLSRVELYDVLTDAEHSVHPLAEQHRVEIALDPADEPIVAHAPAQVLKQAIICILNEAITHVAGTGDISLQARTVDGNPIIDFSARAAAADLAALQAVLHQDDTITYLLRAMNARLDTQQPNVHHLEIALALPEYARKILVIDDNPDVEMLIRRYLANSAYGIVGAQDAMEGITLARRLQPFAIILDVMMPQWDGWEVLQNLKTHPTTQHIPVLICSVLDTPELALSLGADRFIKKPPDRMALLAILARLVE